MTVNFAKELCAGFLNNLNVTLVNYTKNGEDTEHGDKDK